jgi:hypothetical protein
MRHHYMLVSPNGTVAGSSDVFGLVGRRVCGTLHMEFAEYPFHALW